MRRNGLTGLMALILLLSVVMFSGCVEEEALESTPTATPTPTHTPVVTPTPSSTSPTVKITLPELKERIQNALGSEDLVTGLTYDNGVYEIKYRYKPWEPLNENLDRALIEDLAFRIMTVFLRNNITDAELIKIEA